MGLGLSEWSDSQYCNDVSFSLNSPPQNANVHVLTPQQSYGE